MKNKAVIGMMVLFMSISVINLVCVAENSSVETTTETNESRDTVRDEQQVNDNVDSDEITETEKESIDLRDISEVQNSENRDEFERQTEQPVELNLNYGEFTTGLLEALEIREDAVEGFQKCSDK